MRIFLSVGSQLPFDRLVRAVDQWAAARRDLTIEAQIGDATYRPQNMRCHRVLDARTFDRKFREADLVIGHAGMGIILRALVSGKSLVVMPRTVALGEVNTDHQLATAEALERRLGLNVAWDEAGLGRILEHVDRIQPGHPIGPFASDPLIDRLRQFIADA